MFLLFSRAFALRYYKIIATNKQAFFKFSLPICKFLSVRDEGDPAVHAYAQKVDEPHEREKRETQPCEHERREIARLEEPQKPVAARDNPAEEELDEQLLPERRIVELARQREFVLELGLYGNGHDKDRSLPLFASDSDVAAVISHDVLRDVKSKSVA